MQMWQMWEQTWARRFWLADSRFRFKTVEFSFDFLSGGTQM